MWVGRRSKLPVRGGRPKLAGQWTAAPALTHARSFRNRHTRVSMGMPAATTRLRAPARSFVLFAARRRADHRALAELAKKDRQPALALTDTDNMFGALEFSEKMAGAGIQPIIGCALGDRFRRPGTSRRRRPGRALPRIVLLAAREDGYRSLMRLCSRAYLERADRAAAHQARVARRRGGRPDRAQRRSGRAARSRDRRRPKRARAVALRGIAAPVRRPPLHRAAAPRHGGGAAWSSRR